MKPRILVVDDEESIREFLDIMLKKEGYEVTCAEDGAEAQARVRKRGQPRRGQGLPRGRRGQPRARSIGHRDR